MNSILCKLNCTNELRKQKRSQEAQPAWGKSNLGFIKDVHYWLGNMLHH